jgi:hypothetical protein
MILLQIVYHRLHLHPPFSGPSVDSHDLRQSRRHEKQGTAQSR